MKTNNFYLRMLSRFFTNLLYLIGAMVVAIGIVAIICGEGNKGLLDLF